MIPPQAAPSPSWHLITGEYPPGGGGVGEYTRQLADALAAERLDVHVWAPAEAASSSGPTVHHVPGFGRAGLRAMGRALDAIARPRLLLVQYAPQAFGMRGMNVGFCRWVLRRARAGDEVRVMFHEPYVEFSLRHPRRTPIAMATKVMAMLLLRAARIAYVSTPAWERLLRPWAPRTLGPMPWLPIPSTIPRVDDASAVAALRTRLAAGAYERSEPVPLPGGSGRGTGAQRQGEVSGEGQRIVGHFGTYGGMITPLLEPVLRAVLAPPSRSILLLLGDGGPAFAAGLERAEPALRGRIVAPGRQPPRDLSLHLQACDVLVQPYPDGVSARRTTVMAALANGAPVVTTAGRFTEPVWRDTGIPLAPAGDASAMAAAVLDLLDDAPRRERLGRLGRDLYQRHFAMDRTLATLLGE